MAKIVRAVAFANNEVAFLAWQLDQDSIPDCLGFNIVREYLDANDKVIDEKPLAAYVAFKGQKNPDWRPQNTTVWPVQKFNWRDLTLRKRRDAATRRRVDDLDRTRAADRPLHRSLPERTLQFRSRSGSSRSTRRRKATSAGRTSSTIE